MGEQSLLVVGRLVNQKRALANGVERRGERNIKALAIKLKECFPNSSKLKAWSQSVANSNRDRPVAEEVGCPALCLGAGACSIEAEYGSKRDRYVDILQKMLALAEQVSDHRVNHTGWAVKSFGILKNATEGTCDELDTFLTHVACLSGDSTLYSWNRPTH